jgi:protein TonB
MFESTLEAQRLDDGERRLGTLSAAALVHAGVGVAILGVTAMIVPAVKGPGLPPPVVITVLPPRLDDLVQRPANPPPPKKGSERARPGRATVSPPPAPEQPPTKTPETIPDTPPESASDAPPGPGAGTEGDPNGSRNGVVGGTGDDAGGAGGAGTQAPAALTAEMVRPVLLVKVEPSFPQAARLARVGGRVTLRAVVSVDGSVESVEVLASTNALFDASAVDAVRRWRYRPALMDGKPVRVYFTVVVDFLVR